MHSLFYIRRAFFSYLFVFGGTVFRTYDVLASMLSPSIRYLLPPPYLKHRKHIRSTVQHSAVNSHNKRQSKSVPIRAPLLPCRICSFYRRCRTDMVLYTANTNKPQAASSANEQSVLQPTGYNVTTLPRTAVAGNTMRG